MKLLILQQVADLGQQNFLSGGSGRCGRLSSSCFLFLLLVHLGELVQALDQHKDHKGQNKLSEIGKKEEEEAAAPAEPPAPPAPSAEEVLLTEIRDLLKNK